MVRIDVRTIPNALYFEQVKTMLHQAKMVKIPVVGTSMLPFLQEGDVVSLSSPGERDVVSGRIVLAYYNKRYVLHRVVRVAGVFVYLAGDNNLAQLEGVNKKDVIAVVMDAYRHGRPLYINTWPQILNARLWYRLRPLRSLYWFLFNRILK